MFLVVRSDLAFHYSTSAIWDNSKQPQLKTLWSLTLNISDTALHFYNSKSTVENKSAYFL